ncbi:MAG: putative sensor histidine kinase with a response regulator receiver domain, partial [Bradyrhizobium sp.]|nr:putative sensor histidine kinase with a response regulator receiver domain [Bradyrhizobium sp.]
MPQNCLPAEAAAARICRAQRMEIVGQLTGGVVHDFNNILTVIVGMIEILSESVADRPQLAAVAALIAEAADRGAGLTSHLMAFARGKPSQPREVDVNALLVEAARLLRPTLGEQIEIDTMLAADVSPAWIDPSQLMTAILYLAIVARDAMPEGGKLGFATASSVAAKNDAGAAADHIVIAVNASGHGVTADGEDSAFADLGITDDIIRQCNGDIEIRRGAGRSTSVEIHLPKATSLARPSVEDSGKRIEGGDEAVLIVEDDALVRGYVVVQVQSLGYRTLTAANAHEALAVIDDGEKIDLLFTDMVMPGSIDGRQL